MLEKLLKENKLDKIPQNLNEAERLLTGAREDMSVAKKNFEINMNWSFTILYHAGIRILRALLISKGLRTKGKSQHVTLLKVSENLLKRDLEELFDFLDTMRRKRHHFIYDAYESISKADVEQGFKEIKHLFTIVQEHIQVNNPQKKLFSST